MLIALVMTIDEYIPPGLFYDRFDPEGWLMRIPRHVGPKEAGMK